MKAICVGTYMYVAILLYYIPYSPYKIPTSYVGTYIVYNAITTYMYLCYVQLAQRINSACICMYV